MYCVFFSILTVQLKKLIGSTIRYLRYLSKSIFQIKIFIFKIQFSKLHFMDLHLLH